MKINANISIKLEDLSRALNIIIDHVKQQSGEAVSVSEDYYWEISERQLYDPTNNPSEFNLGQLSHDWERVDQILSGESPPIGYAFTWLGSLLRIIGQMHVA